MYDSSRSHPHRKDPAILLSLLKPAENLYWMREKPQKSSLGHAKNRKQNTNAAGQGSATEQAVQEQWVHAKFPVAHVEDAAAAAAQCLVSQGNEAMRLLSVDHMCICLRVWHCILSRRG